MSDSQPGPAGVITDDPWDQPLSAEDEAKIEQARWKEIESRLRAGEEPWMPEPGEMLVGRIVKIGVRSSRFGDYPALTVRQADGSELVFHGFRTVALNELKRLKPHVGDDIGVVYQGQGKGQDYHGYRIELHREVDAGLDWEQFAMKSKPEV